MKKNLFKLFMFSALMLPQLAAAFPNFDKPSQQISLLFSLLNKSPTTIIDGESYNFEWKCKDEPAILLIDLFGQTIESQGIAINSLNINDFSFMFKFLGELFNDNVSQETKNELFNFLNKREPNAGLTREVFELGFNIMLQKNKDLFAKITPEEKKLLELFTNGDDTCSDIKKIGNSSDKQLYQIDYIDLNQYNANAKFFLSSTNIPTSAPKPKAASDTKKADKKKDKKAAKKAKKKAKKKDKKAAKKVATK